MRRSKIVNPLPRAEEDMHRNSIHPVARHSKEVALALVLARRAAGPWTSRLPR